ncbi:MAG: CGGC domain-containing protein [Candidatus Riflebacteria bacterium]|nr:CGGC domain-containing protein [Candidatus Riflebacteria bacterium]
MTKIGILSCSNSTQDARCCTFGCLEALNKNEDCFAFYSKSGGATLTGIINCNGCPTVVAPEKILSSARSLAGVGVEVIHFSSCMVAVCPYVQKFKSLIEQNFPSVKVVLGTHGNMENKESLDFFRAGLKNILLHKRFEMIDFIQEIMKDKPSA